MRMGYLTEAPDRQETSSREAQGWRSLPVFVAPTLVAGAMAVYAAASFAEVCPQCSTLIPPWVVLLASGAWSLVAVRAKLTKLGFSAICSSILLSVHIGVIVGASQAACMVCWILLSLEGVAVALLTNAHYRSLTLRTFSRGYLPRLMVPIPSLLLAYIVSTTYLGVLPPTSLSFQRPGLTVYVIVRRNCGACSKIEDKLRTTLASTPSVGNVVILDSRDHSAQRLIDRHKLTHFPSFVALLDNGNPVVQHGGTVVTFLARLTSAQEANTNSHYKSLTFDLHPS